jgi:arsenate reductase
MKTILFVCVHNAGRSQMAEAILNERASGRGLNVRGISAGTRAAQAVNPQAVAAVEELGISMANAKPKQLTPELIAKADRIVTMGCGGDADECPAGFLVTEDWGLDDPAGQPIEIVRAIRDQIVLKIDQLLDTLQE